MQLRTNLFHFDPELLAPVYQLMSTPEYRQAWRTLRSFTPDKTPSTRTLESMLAVMSGGPAWVNPYADDRPDIPAIALLRPLEYHRICEAIQVWSSGLFDNAKSLDREAYKRLVPSEATELYAGSLIGPDRQAAPAYAVIPWMVTQAMAAAPMQSSIPLDLILSTDATLLAWERPITYQYRSRAAWAMHAVNAQLLLVNRRPLPYIAINVHLSHLLPQWRHPTKSAWLRTSTGVSKLPIHILPKKDDHFPTVYTSDAPRLLEQMGFEAFPPLGGDSIPVDSLLRPIHTHVPAGWPVGKGTGPLFLDQACFHLLHTVPGTRPMLANRVAAQLRAVKPSRSFEPHPVMKVAVVTAHTDTMSRVLYAYERLGEVSKVFAELAVPSVELTQIACPGALQALCTSTMANDVEVWFHQHLLPRLQTLMPDVAIIETSAEATRKQDADPKHILRTLCAQHGIPTQFIMHITEDEDTEEPEGIESTDYPAINGLIDALRGGGFVPSPLARSPGIPDEMTVLSTYFVEIRTPSPAKYLPVITRTRVGDRHLEVYWPDKDNDGVPKWFSYREGLCRIHATAKLMTKQEAQQLVAKALLAPTPVAGAPLLVAVSATLKRLYPGLNDGPGEGLPNVPADAFLVRIRADDQTAQMSGDHTDSPDAAKYIGTRLGVFQAEDHDRLNYFVSYTKHYNRVKSQRKNTRYDIHGSKLKDPWQQLGVTEMVTIHEGNFATSDAIARQIGLWCKNAPLWDGHTRFPSPMHAAKQIALDHPVVERRR